MKVSSLLLATLLLAFYSLPAQAVLDHIEQRILEAYGVSVAAEADPFQPIVEALEAAYQADSNPIVHYWWCFALNRQAILLMNAGQDEQALKVLEQGIAQLKALDDPSSEDLALHGSLVSLSIGFRPDLAAILSAEASTLYEKAIEKNDQNLRAYLGVGRSDYYKPAEYGGGLKVESYLQKALTKPDTSTDQPHAPSWGRGDAYYYLAAYYHREGRTGEAKLYCNKGLKDYPTHSLLLSLKNQLP